MFKFYLRNVSFSTAHKMKVETGHWTSANINTLKLKAEMREVFTGNINKRKQLTFKRFRAAKKRKIRSKFVITEFAWVFYGQIWKYGISMDFDKPNVWSEVFEITLMYVAKLISEDSFNSVEMLKQQIFSWYRIILNQTISSDGGWNFFRLTIT